MVCKGTNVENISLELKNRIKKGPVAIIECFEEIPCNPCQTCCPRNAISFDGPLTSIPKLDMEKCNGCSICVTKCPGMAIFVVDGSYSDAQGLVSIPYEFLPLPEKDQKVCITGRDGARLCEGKIHNIRTAKGFDSTAIVTLRVPTEHLMKARGFKFISEGDESNE